jgi:MFS family permease
MKQSISYKPTITACYISNIGQAITFVLPAIFLTTLRELYGITFAQFGTLVLISFVTQVISDVVFSGPVDKYGVRPFIVIAHALNTVGLVLFALTPFIFKNSPYTGFVIATFIYSSAGGLMELLLSPIINSIPSDDKAGAMSVLHSLFAWGQIAVGLISTLLLYLFGREFWWVIMLLWVVLPLFNTFNFMRVPLVPPIPEETRQGAVYLMKQPVFYVLLMAILFGGASEVTMSQWASTFLEKAVNVPKIFGDIAGMCMFALMLGIGRLTYGIKGKSINISKVMLGGSVLAFICYVTAALASVNIISVIACALCGLGVSLLWPGSIVLATEKFPLAGAWMFAILSASGDIGASIGPWITGFAADNVAKIPYIASYAAERGLFMEQIGLRSGILIAAVFPVLAFICIITLRKMTVQDVK